MKILVISNLYPPYHVGGYELACHSLVEKLKERGHEVKVLTSSYPSNKARTEGDTFRWLRGSFNFEGGGDYSRIKMLQREVAALWAFWKMRFSFNPDIIFIWNLAYMPISAAKLAQQIGCPICYYVFDNWLSRWEAEAWHTLWLREPDRLLTRIGKKMLCRVASSVGLDWSASLNLQNVYFASRYLWEQFMSAGKYAGDARLIAWGVELERFPFREVVHSPQRLLFVGQLVPHKGVHTAIEALALLVHKHKAALVSLSIVGSSVTPEYVVYLQELVRRRQLEDRVQFYGPCSAEQIPGIYQEHDILLFPSCWDEPFGIVLLEAMSSGLAVVATGSGGSADILQDEMNALLFPKENARACARQLLRLMTGSELFERIRGDGRRTVEERFRFKTSVDKIEAGLQEAVAKHRLTTSRNPARKILTRHSA
jgi:glycosyltransferase involved in cell wall biosynthesis